MNSKKSSNGVLSVIVSLFSSVVVAFITYIMMQDATITAAMALITAIAVSTGFLIHAIENSKS